jgi:alginate production protein
MRPFASLMLAAATLVTLLASTVAAREPGYMKLQPHVGRGVEIKAKPGPDGLLVATDIEAMPEPRSPRMRGRLEAVDHEAGTLTMYGRTVAVDERTETVGKSFADLRAGDRAYVKARPRDDGTWRAREIETRGIKSSDKIKGTITEMWVDGVAPDTLSISGLLILLVERTDFDQAAVLPYEVEDQLFEELAYPDASYADRGWASGDGRWHFTAQYRHNALSGSDFDLTDRFDSDRDETQPELRAYWSGYWSPTVRTFVDLRLRQQVILASDQDLPGDGLSLSLNQAYVLARNLGGRGVSLQVGRQRFEEAREWIFDDYLDAARVHLYGDGPLGADLSFIHPVEPLKDKFATWTDWLAQVHWRLDDDSAVSAWMLKRSDSDEVRNREPTWWGLRYVGEPHRLVDAWVDAAIMRGEDKHRPVRGWAIDIGGTLQLWDVPTVPAVSMAYALGSGDETRDDGIDHAFRQTGYQDNSARLGGLSSVRYYGLALDPELSNLEIITVAAAVRPVAVASLEVLYHRYRQHHPDDDLRGDLVDPPARPNGVNDDIGWGLDLVLSTPRLWDRLDASLTYGIFQPGAAYDPRRNRAHLVKLNVTMRFWTT